jgi:peptide deformylase
MLDDSYCFEYVCSFFLGGHRKKDLNCKEEEGRRLHLWRMMMGVTFLSACTKKSGFWCTILLQAGDPVLHEPAEEVKKEDIGSVHIEKTINDMVATMRNAPGVGLAAPQIGVPLQIIVLEDTTELMSYTSVEECEAQYRYPFDLLVIINPRLTKKTNSGSAFFFEGCLSVEGYRALVERYFEVEVSGLGRDGQPITVAAKGWKARILQHECDHLQGILYVDRMVPRSFRTTQNLRLPLPAGCPKPGICMSQFCT